MKKLLSTLLVIITGIVAANAQHTPTQHQFRCQGIDRTYHLYLPDNLPDDAPLVFVLHGYGGNALKACPEMMKVADEFGFAVCFPQGHVDTRNKPCWIVGYPFQEGVKTDDVKFLERLAKHLQKTHNLSSENTFLTGMSNGGEMCYLLARKSRTFKALASIAGLTMTWMYDQLPANRPIPFMEVHGTNDTVSYWTGDIDNQYGWGSYMPVPIAVNAMVIANHCKRYSAETLPRYPDKANEVILHRYYQGTNDAEVWFYQINGGKHTWAMNDMDTPREIWKFFAHFIK